VSALEILAAALLVLGSFLVLRVVFEADPVNAPPREAAEGDLEESPPLRRAA
jgi:hypothetical protein